MSTGGRGRWLIVVFVLAACGAAAGVWAGREIAADEPAVVASVAVAGFGLGGLIGMLGLGFRAVLLRAVRLFSRSAQEAPPGKAPPAPVAPDPEPEPAAQPEPEPEPEPEPLPAPAPPPPGEEPGWYPDPDQPARNRYWDGQTWTAHVSRDREARPRRRRARP